jgi:ABC-type Fe3+-hydroxamate transport system substrate-binding protein
MMSRMRTLISAVLALSVLALAACGGGSGDDSSAAPTRAEFIAKTDAQCKLSNARTKTLNEESRRAVAGRPRQARLLQVLAPILARAYGQVRDNAAAFQAASPPSDDAAEIENIRKLYDEQAEIVRRLGAAAKQGDLDRYKAITEEQKDALARLRKATTAYGFKECGSTKSDAT